jgi:hypothetical protein
MLEFPHWADAKHIVFAAQVQIEPTAVSHSVLRQLLQQEKVYKTCPVDESRASRILHATCTACNGGKEAVAEEIFLQLVQELRSEGMLLERGQLRNGWTQNEPRDAGSVAL